jgi:hypothetical protein
MEKGCIVRYFHLSELFDLTIIQKMANVLCKAAGMPIGIIDAIDGSILIEAGRQDIYVKSQRVNPESLQRCHVSDDFIKDRLVESEACNYKCRDGLWNTGKVILWIIVYTFALE